ncbi:MAG: DNA polymerase III subunit chi [Gammaproteobacteria bacterium]
MTRIDFYVTGSVEPHARERLACRIAEKAVASGQRLHIHALDESVLATLDELLWTFRDVSFLPHARLGSDDSVPVTLGAESAPEPLPQVLINLAAEIPGFFSRFERVVEIVSANPGERELGREHFRFYRDRGYPLQHHNV